MKICMFTSSFLPNIGGAEFAVHHLSESYVKAGHDVLVLAGRGKDNSIPIPHHYRVARYRFPPKGMFVKTFLLPMLFFRTMRENFDVIHANFTYYPGYIASLLKQIVNVPVIVTAHGEDIQVKPEINYGMRLNPKRKKCIEWMVRKADLLVGITESMEEDFADCGAERSRFRHIPHGTDVEAFENAPDVRELFSLPKGCPVIIGIGRNHPKKRFIDLIEALPKVLQKIPGAKLVLVGKATDQLLPRVKELGLQESVLISDPITGSRYNSIYSGADIYAAPSEIEGSPLAHLDALGAGLPMVVTQAPGNIELVKDGINGLVVPLHQPGKIAEAITRILENGPLKKLFSENSKKKGIEHDWKNVASRYLSLYAELTEKQKGNS